MRGGEVVARNAGELERAILSTVSRQNAACPVDGDGGDEDNRERWRRLRAARKMVLCGQARSGRNLERRKGLELTPLFSKAASRALPIQVATNSPSMGLPAPLQGELCIGCCHRVRNQAFLPPFPLAAAAEARHRYRSLAVERLDLACIPRVKTRQNLVRVASMKNDSRHLQPMLASLIALCHFCPL